MNGSTPLRNLYLARPARRPGYEQLSLWRQSRSSTTRPSDFRTGFRSSRMISSLRRQYPGAGSFLPLGIPQGLRSLRSGASISRFSVSQVALQPGAAPQPVKISSVVQSAAAQVGLKGTAGDVASAVFPVFRAAHELAKVFGF